jgi:hypothetical protein
MDAHAGTGETGHHGRGFWFINWGAGGAQLRGSDAVWPGIADTGFRRPYACGMARPWGGHRAVPSSPETIGAPAVPTSSGQIWCQSTGRRCQRRKLPPSARSIATQDSAGNRTGGQFSQFHRVCGATPISRASLEIPCSRMASTIVLIHPLEGIINHQ